MKVARFSSIRPQFDVTSMFGGGTAGGSAGQVPTSNGSNVSFGSNVGTLWANGSNQILGPAVNIAAGSNIVLTLDQGPGGSSPSNTVRIHSTGGGVGGVTAITSNGSNSLAGTVNLVAGTDIALGVSGQTITVTSLAAGGGGVPGGGGDAFAPSVTGYRVEPFSSTASKAVTITAAASGQRIVVAISSYNQDVTGISCTNVTFTEVLSAIQGAPGAHLSVYVGVVSGGSSGTTITITTATATNIFATAITINDAVAPTIVDTATMTGTSSTTDQGKLIGPIDCSIGDLLIFGWATNNANALTEMPCSSPLFLLPGDATARDGLRVAVGMAGAESVSAYFIGGPNASYAAGIVAVS